jgi:hypothetical protein
LEEIMSDIFYVKDIKGNLIPARYMTLNGIDVIDKNLLSKPYDPNLSQANKIYNQDGSVSANQNTSSKLIVPANYDEQKLYQAAQYYIGIAAGSITPDVVIAGGMSAGFSTGGRDDLQRNYIDPNSNLISNGAPVQAFTDAASWHLGAVTYLVDLPEFSASVGGGALNTFKRVFVDPKLDTSGDFWGNTPRNATSISAGYADIKSAYKKPAPCFLTDTLILRPDGTSTPIQHIKVGDEVATFNGDDNLGRGVLQTGKVRQVFGNITREVIGITYHVAGQNHTLYHTPKHVMMTESGKFKEAYL